MSFERPAEELGARVAELTEENARLAEAVAARDAFLITAAHELRNAMTPIIGRVAMLRRSLRKGDMSAEPADRSLDQIEWLISLFMKRATTLLDMSRIASGKLNLARVAVDIRDVAGTVLRTFGPIAEQAGSDITLDMPESGLVVMGDALSIEEILDNLVSNAIKYGAGAPIVLHARPDAKGDMARISVQDGGPGISAQDQARMLEPFERAVPPGQHSGGFGVGLWIVKRLVDAMDGTFAVTSAPGAGSTFRVDLPMSPLKDSR